jgi:hypothetical protein
VIIDVGSFSPLAWLYQTFQIPIVICFPLSVMRGRSLDVTFYCVGYQTIINGLPLKTYKAPHMRFSNVPYNRCMMQ